MESFPLHRAIAFVLKLEFVFTVTPYLINNTFPRWQTYTIGTELTQSPKGETYLSIGLL